MLRPIKDSGSKLTYRANERRGYYDYERILLFPQEEAIRFSITSFMEGMKFASKDMWFYYKIKRTEEGTEITINHGYDSGD